MTHAKYGFEKYYVEEYNGRTIHHNRMRAMR